MVCYSWRKISAWEVANIYFSIFCNILKIPLPSILIYKLSLLFICLFNAAIKIWLFIVCWNLPCSENLIDRRKPGIFVPAVLKILCAIFCPFFIQNSSKILIQTLLRLDIIYLRFPKAKDMFKICLIFGYF